MDKEQRHNDEAILAELKGLKELMYEKFANNEKNFHDLRLENCEQHEKFGTRISILELWQSNTVGKITVVSVAIGIGVSIFTAWIIGFFK